MQRKLDVHVRVLQLIESRLIAPGRLTNVASLFSKVLAIIDNRRVDLKFVAFLGHLLGAGLNHEFLVPL